MKLNRLFIIIVSTFLLQSCLFQEKDLFDKSASERIEEAVENLYDVLISAPNGWKMTYYTSPDKYGAYNILMNFDSKEKVTMQGDKLFESGKHSSYYTINRSQGVVLDFNEYNKVISLLANGALFNTDGSTLGGDNEFVWQRTSASQDTIFFKSKKQSAEVQMIRLDENQGWDQYLNLINAVMNEFSAGDLNRYFKILNFDDGSSWVLGGYNEIARSIDVFYLRADGELERATRGVGFTKDGFSFYEPLEIEGRTIQHVPYDTESATFRLTIDGISGQLTSGRPPFVIPGNLDRKLFVARESPLQSDIYGLTLASAELNNLLSRMQMTVRQNKLPELAGLFWFPAPPGVTYFGKSIYCVVLLRDVMDGSDPFAAMKALTVDNNVDGRSDTFKFTPLVGFPGVRSDEGAYWDLLKVDFLELFEMLVGETDGFIAVPDRYFQNITFGAISKNLTFGISIVN